MFNIFGPDPFEDEQQKRFKNEERSTQWALQGSFFDEDDYDDDGNLKSAIDAYEYQEEARSRISRQTYSKSTSANWLTGVRDWAFQTFSNEEERHQKFLKRELNTIARAVNSIRNFGGHNKTEQSIRVLFANNNQKNNVMGNNNDLYLSPDPLEDAHTLKPDWSVDQRRDVIIGEALTLLGMKRMSNPMILREIVAQADRDHVVMNARLTHLRGMDDDNAEQNATIQNKELLRILTCAFWRAAEQDASRSAILKEYRGSLPFFAAVQAYYSDDTLRTELMESIEKYFNDDLPPEAMRGVSVQATRVILWNLNHSYNPAMQIKIPYCTVGIRMDNVLSILKAAIQLRETADRYNHCYEAALRITELEPPPKSKPQDEPQPTDSDNPEQQEVDLPPEIMKVMEDMIKNGDQRTSFDPIDNGSGAGGEVNIDELEDEITSGLSEASEKCRIIDKKGGGTPTLESIRAENYPYLQALRRKLEPCSERNVLPEHGLRSGKLSRSRIWKVGTELPDNDRIFNRNLEMGISRNMTLALLTDFSGSMHGNEIYTAKRIGVLIHDAIQDFPEVRFELWGHEGDYDHNNIYHFHDVESYTSCRTGGGTDEGGAYAAVARQVIRSSHVQDRKVIMAIGDGDTNREVVSNAVGLARRGGVETLNLLIANPNVKENAEAAYGQGNVILIGNDRSKDLGDEILQVVQPWLLRTISKLQKQVV